MTKDDYIKSRNNNNLDITDLYETLCLNPSFKVKNIDEFIKYINIFKTNPLLWDNISNLLKQEYIKLNDIRFNITTLLDKNNKAIKIY